MLHMLVATPLGQAYRGKGKAVTQTKQGEDEKRWVAAMAEKLGLKLDGEPAKQDPPRPDAELTLAGGTRIGVEVVEAMDQATRHGYSGVRAQIVRNATNAMKQRGLAANVGLAMLDGLLPSLAALSKKEQIATALRIVDLAAEAVAIPLEGKIGWMFHDHCDNGRTDGFRYVGDLASRGLQNFSWIQVSPWFEPVVLTLGSGIGAGPDQIQEAIDRKLKKRARYDLEGLKELWLLVVGSAATGGSRDLYDAKRTAFISPFAQTFFLECSEDKCIRLTPRPDADAIASATGR